MLILEFFLYGFQLHILYALGGTHQRRRTNQPCQLIHSEKHLFHFMLRRNIAADAIAMACHRMNHSFVNISFPHQLLHLGAVLLRPLFKIQIVQQTDIAPEIHLVAIAQLLCQIAHHALNCFAVAQMEWLLIIFVQ